MQLGRERPPLFGQRTSTGGWQRGSLTPRISPVLLPTAAPTATWAAQSAARRTAAKSLTRKEIDESICIRPRSRRRAFRWRAARPERGNTAPESVFPLFSSIEVQQTATRREGTRISRGSGKRLRGTLRTLERQHPDARPAFVDRQKRASLDVLTMRLKCRGDDAHGSIGEQVLSSDLHHARRGAGASCEDCREVQVIREDDERVLIRPRQNLDVWSGRSTDS
jgi:hypothetical protein